MVTPTLFRSKFLIRFFYKSGNSHEFWVLDYSIRDVDHKWIAVSSSSKPMMLGVDEIESIFVVKRKMNILEYFKRSTYES